MQQIGDEARGWAWTRALQGLAANEIHLCGDGSALPLVRTLAADMGEPLEARGCPPSCCPGQQSEALYSMLFMVLRNRCHLYSIIIAIHGLPACRQACMHADADNRGLTALLP